ncbi:MAG: 30S ribosomal protein S26e [Candidatus Korarchaeota archaeon]|nr:30S ribosomal protein S26e [Candidatus Korarchaeota archaeon]
MPKKRKSRGRKLSDSGHEKPVQCHACGRLVPADKAVRITRWVSPIGGPLARELEKQGAYISKRLETRYYCISCAVHMGLVRPRAEEDRKIRRPLQARRSRQTGKLPLKFLKL